MAKRYRHLHPSHVHTIPYEDLLNYWPEDMSWISPNVLCVAAADKSCHATDKTVVNHQLALIYDCSVRKVGNSLDYDRDRR